MRPLLLILGVVTLLAGLAVASLPAAQDEDRERTGRLHADLELIEAAVNSGLVLAVENDPLKRAKICSELADRLAKEARRAAGAKANERAADLGRYLQAVLERGVASNLSQANGELPEARSVGERTVALMAPLLEDLERSAGAETPDMRATVKGLAQARTAVEKALKTRPHHKKKKQR
jgi:hypothetical protein